MCFSLDVVAMCRPSTLALVLTHSHVEHSDQIDPVDGATIHNVLAFDAEEDNTGRLLSQLVVDNDSFSRRRRSERSVSICNFA